MSAMDLPPPVPAFHVELSSIGMSKGVAQTTGPQFLANGEIDVGSAYVGIYTKNIDSSSWNGEVGGVVGVRTTVRGFNLAVSALVKRELNATPGSDPTALELSASLGRRIGRFTPNMMVIWSPNDTGPTRQSYYVEANVDYALSPTVSIRSGVARHQQAGAIDYTAWNAGATWTPSKHFAFDARYYDTSGGDGTQPYRARLVVAGTLSF
jgi:hypothetical protein